MKKSGVEVIASTEVTSVEKSNDRIKVNTSNSNSIATDCLIWAIGREPSSKDLNLEAANVKVDANHFIQVNEWQETSAKNIFSVGDVCGNIPLTPVAIAAGRRLMERLFNNKSNSKMDFSYVPSVVFSHPPLGSVGLTEYEAIATYGADQIKMLPILLCTYVERKTNFFFELLKDIKHDLSI